MDRTHVRALRVVDYLSGA